VKIFQIGRLNQIGNASKISLAVESPFLTQNASEVLFMARILTDEKTEG
jgi:hypothetical protein